MSWFSKFMREFLLVGEVCLEVCMLVNMTLVDFLYHCPRMPVSSTWEWDGS